MKCGNCGAGNAYNATVCIKCGSALSANDFLLPSGFGKKPPKQQEQASAAPKKAPIPTTPQGMKEVKEDPMKPQPQKQTQGSKNTKSAPSKKPPQKASSQTSGSKTGATTKQTSPAPVGSRKASPKAYNRTTSNLSLAEKVVKKANRKRGLGCLFPLLLILALCAAAIFSGRIQFYRNDDRYTQIAEQFVQAVAMNDEASASQCVHSRMQNSLRSLGYRNAERCETKAERYEELPVGETKEELYNRYGIDDPISRLFRVHVKYTVYAEQNYEGSMDVLVANIGGQIYAIKTENISDTQIPTLQEP